MLHVIHIQPFATNAIQPFDPGRDLAQVFLLRRNHQHRIQLVQRHETQQPGDWRPGPLAQQLIQLGGHGLAIDIAQPEHADRHALQPIDVKGVNGGLHAGEFRRSAGQHQQVAIGIGAQDTALGEKGRDDGLHLGGADITQGNDAHAKTDAAASQTRALVAQTHGTSRRHHPVHATLAHQHGIIHAQQGFQGRQQLIGGQWPTGLHRHLALHLRVDDVVFLQRLEHHLDHVANAGAFEIKRHACARRRGGHRSRLGSGGAIDELAAA